MTDIGARNLQRAILINAVFDLKKEIRAEKGMVETNKKREALEKWFLSEWGELLSGGRGELIIELCHRDPKISKGLRIK